VCFQDLQQCTGGLRWYEYCSGSCTASGTLTTAAVPRRMGCRSATAVPVPLAAPPARRRPALAVPPARRPALPVPLYAIGSASINFLTSSHRLSHWHSPGAAGPGSSSASTTSLNECHRHDYGTASGSALRLPVALALALTARAADSAGSATTSGSDTGSLRQWQCSESFTLLRLARSLIQVQPRVQAASATATGS
jgi:hypothetical protein